MCRCLLRGITTTTLRPGGAFPADVDEAAAGHGAADESDPSAAESQSESDDSDASDASESGRENVHPRLDGAAGSAGAVPSEVARLPEVTVPIPMLSATLQPVLAQVDGLYQDDARATLEAGGKYDFLKDLGFTLPIRGTVVRESSETYVCARTGARQLVGGKDVRFVNRRGDIALWIHQRHLKQSDLEYQLEHSHLPFFVLRVLRVDARDAGPRDPDVTLELQSELSNFAPYQVTHTLSGWKRDLTERVGTWLTHVVSGRMQVFPVDAPPALGKNKQVSHGAAVQIDWRGLVGSCSLQGALPASVLSGPSLVVHLLPGVEHRAFLTAAVRSAYLHAGSAQWACRVELAPLLAHPKDRQTTLLPVDRAPLAPSVHVLFVAAHTTGSSLLLTWSKDYIDGSGLHGDVHRPVRPGDDSMARVLQELVGRRTGLCIVLLCCGLSEAELRSLARFCRKTACAVVLPGGPQVLYLSPLDPTLREFSNLADAYTRVAVQLGGPVPAEVGLEMARALLPATSLLPHPPIYLGPCGQRHVLSATERPPRPPTAAASLQIKESSPSVAMEIEEECQLVPVQARDSTGKVRKVRIHCKKNCKVPSPHAQLRTVEPVEHAKLAELASSLPPTVRSHLVAETMWACTAEVSSLGRCTVLFTCVNMFGGDAAVYRKRTINIGRNLKATKSAAADPKPLADAAWLLHDVSSADAEELLRLFYVSTKRQPSASPALVTKPRKVFVLTEAAPHD